MKAVPAWLKRNDWKSFFCTVSSIIISNVNCTQVCSSHHCEIRSVNFFFINECYPLSILFLRSGDISERDGQWVTSVSMLPHLETQITFLRQVLNPHFSIFVHPHFLQTWPVSCCSSLAHTGNPLSTVTGVMKRAWLEFITMAEERKGESMTAGNRQALTVGSVSASYSLRVWDMGSWEEESIAEESLRNHFVPN